MVKATIYTLCDDGSKEYFDTVKAEDWSVVSHYVLSVISNFIKTKEYEYWEVERTSWDWVPKGFSGVLASGVKKRHSGKWIHYRFLVQQIKIE